TTANNIDNESSTTLEEENNPHQLKNLNWPKIYPWVYRGEGQLNKYIFCYWCKEASKNNNFSKGCRYFKKQSLDCHITTSDHEIVCAARMQSQATLYSSFAIQARNNQINIIKNMRNIYFLIQHNLSTNIFKSLYKLSKLQPPYSSYQNNVTAREFIESIGYIIEQE
ncbi:3163_t:CDS:2, partial [Scutellospora calospora]